MLNWPAFAECTSPLDLQQASSLLTAFVANNNGRLHALSIEGRARSSVSRLARAIKVSAGELGFVGVEQCAREVETEACAASDQALNGLIGQLGQSLEEAIRTIEGIQSMAAFESP